MENTATAGNKGKRVRSDCHVTIRLTNAGGIDIELTSKVKFMFGADIMRRIHEVLDFFEIENAHVMMEDSGAL
ncbi:MAG: hypothetical protein PHX39_08660, partial [Bacteroidales bacterium]|nr:hypothetical protein [Bacteroidales bacterium]